MSAFAGGIAAMIDVVGVDHVGLGTDMLGLTGPAVFDSYAQLPALREALYDTGFDRGEIARICGGNYARVFDAATDA
jgi:membrane dipeptidase